MSERLDLAGLCRLAESLARPHAIVPAVSEPATRRWVAVNAYCGREFKAASEISALDYLAYVPRFKTERWSRRKGKRKQREIVQRPLFGGYLFVRLDPLLDPWRELERVDGVIGLVRGAEDRPLVVPDVVIEELQAREPYNFGQPCRNVDARLREFKVGSDVRLVDGNLIGFFGKVEAIDERGRITLLVDLFRRLTPITVNPDQVEAA